jgi:site-specific DNA-methyltransferase (adenine-specific)
MKSIPDKRYDLCLTDPPYNVNKDYGSDDNLSPEEYKQWSIKWFNEAKRISKGLLFTPGHKYLQMWLTEIEYPKWIVAWYKPNTIIHCVSKLKGLIQWEPYIAYGEVILRKDAFNVPMRRQKLYWNTSHPNPRSIPLTIQILKMSNGVKKVIDPFMGIGTTLIACKELGIECDGIEINQSYCDEAKSYLEKVSIPLRPLQEFF